MKQSANIVAAAVLATAAVSANAWWGPGWGYPAWGYAPLHAVPAYGHAPVAPWGDPFANDPMFGDMSDFSKAPELPAAVQRRLDESTAAFEQSKKMSEARTAAFNKRAEMQRAAMEARRQAWRDARPQLGSYEPFALPSLMGQPEMPAAPEQPATGAAEVPSPVAEAQAQAVPAPAAQ